MQKHILQLLQQQPKKTNQLAKQFKTNNNNIENELRQLKNDGVILIKNKLEQWEWQFPILEWLDKSKIISFINKDIFNKIDLFEVFFKIPSTSLYLLEQTAPIVGNANIVLTEMQTQGRGQRGKTWVSPLAGNIYFSMQYCFRCSLSQLSGLSLVVGIAVAKIFKLHNINIGLKWPNDLFFNNKKLGGILLEISQTTPTETTVVIGIGINMTSMQLMQETIDQPWTSLQEIQTENNIPIISRNKFIADLIQELFDSFILFSKEGLIPFLNEYSVFDILNQRNIDVKTSIGNYLAIAQGITSQGYLKIVKDQQLIELHSGEVTIRVTL